MLGFGRPPFGFIGSADKGPTFRIVRRPLFFSMVIGSSQLRRVMPSQLGAYRALRLAGIGQEAAPTQIARERAPSDIAETA
jgi:hypothetical protein